MRSLLSVAMAGVLLSSSVASGGHCQSTCQPVVHQPARVVYYYPAQHHRVVHHQPVQQHRIVTHQPVQQHQIVTHQPVQVAYAPVALKPADIVETAVGAGSFKTLVAAVQAAGLVDTLKGKGPFTVFAPTDDAFAKLPAGTVENLLKPENKKQLQAVLTYHVVAGRVKAADVVKLSSAETVQGQSVSIKVAGGKMQVDNANVVKTDISCSNGVIHVIDSVILPKESKEQAAASSELPLEVAGVGSFKTLFAAVEAAGLTETLTTKGPFTVFAPTDEAFANLPAGTVENLLKPENREKLQAILTYHVVPGKVLAKDVVGLTSAKTVNGKNVAIKVEGGKVQVNGATVIKTDLECELGVIHAIDAVILP